ncbi:MAG TPA: hypothetical protein VKR53_01705 [Puia sp.]|nr:hypothetical protein [Puia sp.]
MEITYEKPLAFHLVIIRCTEAGGTKTVHSLITYASQLRAKSLASYTFSLRFIYYQFPIITIVFYPRKKTGVS